MGALLLEGTEDALIADCLFERIDGNAVFLSGYNRRAQVLRNEFALLGNNAVASWGRSVDFDGTGGQQPRHSLIMGNIAHDVGLEQKQSSFYFQAQSCENVIAANIVYNIPRAAINFEDGFGGANVLTDNLLYNTCRESSDREYPPLSRAACTHAFSPPPPTLLAARRRRLQQVRPTLTAACACIPPLLALRLLTRAPAHFRPPQLGPDALRDDGARRRHDERHPSL